ncbi:AraC family transcriptional regulator [Mesorhizobium sp. M9A.F.Ca.ET.002.03.1.2]|uniref:AraC family transcriptional regulator n=1 Tax=Mesorhizobium sp. M9A.F.Ca.ET.002.03.1.2 TaxID=2493668 RepID=UPI001FE03B15|nr:AraC family transcriptional regulator [Mesorhizobium sp. M9A.F.Ca.ET.002.03.1.2]
MSSPEEDMPISSEGVPALKPLSFSTRGLAREEQFGAWQSLLEPLFDVSLPENASPKEGFVAEHVAWNLGNLLIVQQDVPANSYNRSSARLRSSSLDHWYLGLLHDGQTWTEVDGHVAANQPGKVEFRSLGYPFRGRATASRSVLLYLPREIFEDAAPALDARNNSILSGNAAKLLVDYVSAIEARLHTLVEEDLDHVVRATRDIIVACFSPSRHQDAVAEQLAGIALMERARRYVQRNLNSADLTSDAMCRALAISRTRLYQLFEPSGGVNHYIQRRRLLTAHAALSDPEEPRRIIEIAEAVGFSSAATFSRAFSKEFGYSPREARNAIISSRRRRPVSASERNVSPSFEDWLRTLGS